MTVCTSVADTGHTRVHVSAWQTTGTYKVGFNIKGCREWKGIIVRNRKGRGISSRSSDMRSNLYFSDTIQPSSNRDVGSSWAIKRVFCKSVGEIFCSLYLIGCTRI